MNPRVEAVFTSLITGSPQKYGDWYRSSNNIFPMDPKTFDNIRKDLLKGKQVEKHGRLYHLTINAKFGKRIYMYTRWLDTVKKKMDRAIVRRDSEQMLFLAENCLVVSQKIAVLLTCRRSEMRKNEVLILEKQLEKSEEIIKEAKNDETFAEKIDQLEWLTSAKVSRDGYTNSWKEMWSC